MIIKMMMRYFIISGSPRSFYLPGEKNQEEDL
jgi:hypothetical protein